MQKPSSDDTPLKKAPNLQDVQNSLAPFEEFLLAGLPSKDEILQRARKRQLNRTAGISAMTAVIALVGGVWWYNPVYDTDSWHSQRGEIRLIELSDGSSVRLNTDTMITARYRLRSKEFELVHGEATFNVAHYPWQFMRPLERRVIASTEQLLIEDIGTVFTVRRYSGHKATVSVQQGLVNVSLKSQAEKPVLLQQNQLISATAGVLSDIQQVDTSAFIAWHHGHLQFNHTPLTDALTEFQRYSEFTFAIHQSELAKIPLSGQFSAHHAQQFMQLLPQFAPVITTQDSAGMWHISAKKAAQ